jgi:hypothetical protein
MGLSTYVHALFHGCCSDQSTNRIEVITKDLYSVSSLISGLENRV